MKGFFFDGGHGENGKGSPMIEDEAVPGRKGGKGSPRKGHGTFPRRKTSHGEGGANLGKE